VYRLVHKGLVIGVIGIGILLFSYSATQQTFAGAGTGNIQNGHLDQGLDNLDFWTTLSHDNSDEPVVPALVGVVVHPDGNYASLTAVSNDATGSGPITVLEQPFTRQGNLISFSLGFDSQADSNEIIVPSRFFDDAVIASLESNTQFVTLAQFDRSGLVVDPNEVFGSFGIFSAMRPSPHGVLEYELDFGIDPSAFGTDDLNIAFVLFNEPDGEAPEGRVGWVMEEVTNCGNGVVEPGDACDDGNHNPGDGCDETCTQEGTCGDGIKDAGESCDDGNKNSGDGCSDTCQNESTVPRTGRCGNDRVDAGEQCDDGVNNGTPGSFCTEQCTWQQRTIPRNFCGDGNLNPLAEQCDDGNRVSGDGCSDMCEVEAIECGNERVEAGEECDDGNLIDCDDCSSICEIEICGDGVLCAGPPQFEECDDGNFVNGDGCSDFCELEPPCGNGMPDPGEECDDGNLIACDFCSPTCTIEFCGDGVLCFFAPQFEFCDDGNMMNGDGCSSTCLIEGPPPPSVCGNGVRELGEACDDGNLIACDFCSPFCTIEFCGDGALCIGPPQFEECEPPGSLTCDAFCQMKIPLDFGDAPNSYSTLDVDNGPFHELIGLSELFLGIVVDPELDGIPTPNADGDDLNQIDDEDGVIFTSPLVQGATANVEVFASLNGLLNAWVDFSGDGTFADAGEQIFTDTVLIPGNNALVFSVPADAEVKDTFSRFRINLLGGLSFTGAAADGEVEDHPVTILTAGILSCGDKTIQVGDFCAPVLLTICADGTIADNILVLCNADNTARDQALAAVPNALLQRDQILSQLIEFLRFFGVI